MMLGIAIRPLRTSAIFHITLSSAMEEINASIEELSAMSENLSHIAEKPAED